MNKWLIVFLIPVLIHCKSNQPIAKNTISAEPSKTIAADSLLYLNERLVQNSSGKVFIPIRKTRIADSMNVSPKQNTPASLPTIQENRNYKIE